MLSAENKKEQRKSANIETNQEFQMLSSWSLKQKNNKILTNWKD